MTDLTKIQQCLYVRNGIEIWMDEGKAKDISKDLGNTVGKFIKAEGRIINVADIVGIFTPQDLEDMKRRKNGEVLCKYGKWHPRGQECMCHVQNIKSNIPEYPEISDEKRKENLKKFREMKGDIFK